MTDASRPLAGVRIVEIAQYVAAPMATLALADLGADVIKVETGAKGDAFRTYGLRWAGVSALWLSVNRGKRSVTLDLKSALGRQQVHRLLERADLVVMSSKPGALDDRGLDDATMERVNGRLIRVYVTGFGALGPRAHEPVYDSIIQAMSGLAAFQGGAGDPTLLAPMAVDKVTAMMVAQASLAALYERHITGVGRRVDISLLEAAAYWNFPDLFQDRTFVDDPRRLGQLASPIVPTRESRIVVAPVTGSQMAQTVTAIGHPEWLADLKRHTDHIAVVRDLYERLAPETAKLTTAEALDLFAAAGVPAGPVLGLDEHLADAQVVHGELYAVVDLPLVGRVRMVRYPAAFDGVYLWGEMSVPDRQTDIETLFADWNADA